MAAGDVTLRHEEDAAFLSRIGPELDRIEQVRLDKYESYCWRRKAGAIIAAIVTPITGYIDYALMFLWFGNSSEDRAAGVTIIFLGALWAWITQPKRDYAKVYKRTVLPEIARLLGLSRYEVDGGIPVHEMKPSKILPAHDSYHKEDYFEGVYNRTRVRFSQAHFQERRRSGKRTHYVTVFKGLVLLVDLPKPKFHGHTILVRDSGRFGAWLQSAVSGLQRADLVDPVFEKKYDVFTSDQVEARYLVDPNVIERVNGLAEVYYSDAISVAYYNNKIFAMIACNKNFFEPADIYVPATDPGSVMELKRELEKTLSLVDYFDLDPTTGSRTQPAPVNETA